MTRYFEIYVAGRNGFSAYVKTDKVLPTDFDETILNLAVGAKVIESGDAKDVFHGAGYIEERQVSDIHPKTTITIL
jgi:hypothetical protein